MAELRLALNKIQDSDSKDAIVESTIFNFEHFTRLLEAI